MTTIEPGVLDVLRRSAIAGNNLTLPEQLDRQVYLQVDKVLRALGARWDRRAKAHILSDGASQTIAALGNGEYVDKKKALGFFPTPLAVAHRMIALLDIRVGESVLDPSAGRGDLFAPLPPEQKVIAIEIDEDNVRHLKELERDPKRNVVVWHADFLEWVKTTENARRAFNHRLGFVDVVLMNPPFSRNQDIAHIRAAWPCLKRRGRLCSVMSAHSTFAGDNASVEFRSWAKRIDALVLDLPEGSFKESETGVNTKLFFAERA